MAHALHRGILGTDERRKRPRHRWICFVQNEPQQFVIKVEKVLWGPHTLLSFGKPLCLKPRLPGLEENNAVLFDVQPERGP